MTEISKSPSGKVRPYYVKHAKVFSAALPRVYTVNTLGSIAVPTSNACKKISTSLGKSQGCVVSDT